MVKRHTAMDYSIVVEMLERITLGELLFMISEIADDATLDTSKLYDHDHDS